ncbi:DUF2779 domain-containing protein [Rubripirellula sp.]|nr:DUF2779 domain-containing protein [Rubripirellula sp.]
MQKPRYLTKSRFTLANECPTKLFYTRKDEYANSKNDDDFLKALAESGIVVGELAKSYYANGHDVKPLDYEAALTETNQLLKHDNVVIFEAAIKHQNLFCRVDVLVKEGDQLHLIEVKAKSVDGSKANPFQGRKGNVLAAWKPYVLDVAFQRHALKSAFPEHAVRASLMLVDKSQGCSVNGLLSNFKIQKEDGRTRCVRINDKPVCDKLLIIKPVDAAIDQVCTEVYDGISFEDNIQWLADQYAKDIKIPPSIGKHCKTCEFRCQGVADQEKKDGFRECWTQVLGWKGQDFDRPTIFDLYNFRNQEAYIEQRDILLDEIDAAAFNAQHDGVPGRSASQMQEIRYTYLRDGRKEAFVDHEGLASVMRDWKYPLNMIDFETAMPAVPLHQGMRPYQNLAFQFSHHTLHEDGHVVHEAEYLHDEPGAFPNFAFLRKLKESLEQNEGTIFRYADHENTIICHIIEQLDLSGTEEPDYEDLRNFACSISHPGRNTRNPWEPSERDMVDLRQLVARHYFHPMMKGSQSIKYVLPAVLNDSKFLQDKYAEESYGYDVQPGSSKNFASQTWIQYAGDTVVDPYQLLPNVLDEVDKERWNEPWGDEIRAGGAAMAAYLRLRQPDLPEEYRQKVIKGLLKYCELDTLAMVMIVEAWQSDLAP